MKYLDKAIVIAGDDDHTESADKNVDLQKAHEAFSRKRLCYVSSISNSCFFRKRLE